jgi:ABC-type uncharacterized transport system auxiliary subunit
LEPVPSDTFYRLVCPSPTRVLNGPLSPDGIAVAKFESSGVHKERALVYTDPGGVSLKQHRYHFWVDSPPELLQECLVRYLRKAGASGTVVAGYRPSTGLLVGGRLRRFERAVAVDEVVGGVSLELSVKLRGAEHPLLIREYRKDAKSAGAGIEQSVDALALAVGDVYAEFLDDLARSVTGGSVD